MLIEVQTTTLAEHGRITRIETWEEVVRQSMQQLSVKTKETPVRFQLHSEIYPFFFVVAKQQRSTFTSIDLFFVS